MQPLIVRGVGYRFSTGHAWSVSTLCFGEHFRHNSERDSRGIGAVWRIAVIQLASHDTVHDCVSRCAGEGFGVVGDLGDQFDAAAAGARPGPDGGLDRFERIEPVSAIPVRAVHEVMLERTPQHGG